MGLVENGAGGPAPGSNEALAREVVERVWRAGVRTFVVCPGGRNAPLVESLERVGGTYAEVLHFFDERSAAFFALGRAKREGRPVAIVTTSGTAAAELLPAMIEAWYEGERLVAVTADRPARYRGTGAPQAIDQRRLYGAHVAFEVDLDRPGTAWSLDGISGPAHVNVCFEEPLLGDWRGEPFSLDAPASVDPRSGSSQGGQDGIAPTQPATPDPDGARLVRAFLDEHPRPLVILGALQTSADQACARDFCRALGAPVLAEASSHTWGALHGLVLEGREASAQVLMRSGRVDSVLRIGDVPSFRVWRDLENRPRVPVLSLSRRCWPGLTRGRLVQVETGRPVPFPEPRDAGVWPAAEAAEVFAEDRARWRRIAALLAEYPASEAGLVARLSRAIPRRSSVYLGNSLPIREWNQFAALEDRAFVIRENRGVNGIDGQISTFLGAAERGRENWAVVGDLTALYDLQAPWAVRHCAGITTRIVVINNGGGRIFGRLFENPNFQNRHQTSFEGWATMWSLAWNQDLGTTGDEQAAVIELRPDEAQTTAFWAAWSALRST